MKIVSSSKEVVLALQKSLEATRQLSDEPGSERRYYVSDDAAAFRENAEVFLNEKLGSEVIQVSV